MLVRLLLLLISLTSISLGIDYNYLIKVDTLEGNEKIIVKPQTKVIINWNLDLGGYGKLWINIDGTQYYEGSLKVISLNNDIVKNFNCLNVIQEKNIDPLSSNPLIFKVLFPEEREEGVVARLNPKDVKKGSCIELNKNVVSIKHPNVCKFKLDKSDLLVACKVDNNFIKNTKILQFSYLLYKIVNII